MPVQEILGNLGSWTIKFDPGIPRDVLDAIEFLGHIAIVPGRIDPAQYGDNLLTPGVARYVGVVRTRTWGDDGRTSVIEDDLEAGGSGMAFWLGDEDDKGPVIENSTVFASASFADAVRGLLPASGAVTEGTLYSVPGLYSATHRWQTSRKAIQYVCDTMGTTAAPANWRVNNNATLDAGPEADLFVTDPVCVILPTGGGEDMAMRALVGSTDTTRDVQDYTTRVVLLAEGTGDAIATAAADLDPGSNPYKDLHGNTAAITRMVSESATDTGNASTRAQLALSQYTAPKTNLTLSTADYDVHGTFTVGDYVYVYDPDAGLTDPNTEITFRGQRINPIRLQVTEADWSVTAGYTVAYRDGGGTWTDLTRYVTWETDTTVSVTVGGLQRALTSAGVEQVGTRPNADTSVPGVPVLVEPFQGSAYLDARGFTRARVIVSWTAPNNTDGSTILDGDHYELRYAIDTDQIYPATWTQVSQIRWEDMQTWAQPFAAPDASWQTMVVGWDQTTAQLQDLSPGVGYDVQIRAVDSSGNTGAWSATTTFLATEDNIPPSTPAAPSVAASRIAVQITHTLGKSSGGTFNLEPDLDHLEIHAQYEPTFTPSDTTLLGKLKANAGMIQAQIPAVGTYNVESTDAIYVRVIAVDIAGNRSGPSDAATTTALLIDDAHISDLTVSKVTAGTINADWLVGARIKTADAGPRVELSADGIGCWNADGEQTVTLAAADGSVAILGQLVSASSGRRLEINPTNTYLPEIRFYADTGSSYSFINGFNNSHTPADAAGIQITTDTAASGVFSTVAMDENTATFGRYKNDVASDDYYATGGFSLADDAQIRTAWFSGIGGNYGGSFLAESDHAEIGWFGADTSKWNAITFGSDGWARVTGKIQSTSWAYGSVNIIPVANTPTSVSVTGLTLDGDNFYAFTQAHTGTPGTQVLGTGVSGVGSAGITVWLTRTNTTITTIDYAIIGWY